MTKRLFVLVVGMLFSVSAFALDLSGGTNLREGQNQIKLGGSVLSGVLDPRKTFSHTNTTNKALMFSEVLSYTRGFGDHGLKDLYVEFESLAFQSKSEQVNSTVVHHANNGLGLTLRGGANFIHTTKFSFGGWLQSSVPVIMNKDKFVNPVLNYVGGGLNAGVQLTKGIGITQQAFVGSGLFSPKKRNPNMRSATLGIFNFGQMFWDRDASFSTGAVIEADLTTRNDAAYQASALGDGDIQNLVFITPFIFNIAIGETWRLESANGVKWFGKSSRGSLFSGLSVAKIF